MDREPAHRAQPGHAGEFGLRFVACVFRALAFGHLRQELFIGMFQDHFPPNQAIATRAM
jgi:hypothetical protein